MLQMEQKLLVRGLKISNMRHEPFGLELVASFHDKSIL
jgi:hypothetical protein